MFLVDTNIFLQILLEQPNGEICQRLLEYAQREKITLICTHFSIHSIAVKLSERKKFIALHDFIENIQNMPNLHLHTNSLDEERSIAKLCQKIELDFDDAIQYHTAKTYQCEHILSYDSDFDHTDIKRMTPEEFLSKHLANKN